jgi:hypothetical protein
LFENYDALMVTGQQNKTMCNREDILPMSIGFSLLDPRPRTVTAALRVMGLAKDMILGKSRDLRRG